MNPALVASPVFVHSWWRTSSTYVWSKLRRIEALCCYSEPLHEYVGSLTLPVVRGGVDTKKVANLHHPPLDRPYFAEYEPLVRDGGAGFFKALSYDRFILHPRQRDDELENYFGTLIHSAIRQGKRPVFACVRSSLRAGWMKRRFGGIHIALLRNPRDQWGSMLEQGTLGGIYFVAGVLAIAAKLEAGLPGIFSHIPHRLTNHLADSYNPTELRSFAEDARKLTPGLAYAFFIPIWIASALQILSAGDIVLDSDLISASAAARGSAEKALGERGLPVDFSDWATPRHPELAQSPEALAGIEAAAVRALASHARPLVMASAGRLAERIPLLDPRSGLLLARALEALQAGSFFAGAEAEDSRAG